MQNNEEIKREVRIVDVLVLMFIVVLGVISLLSYNYLRQQLTTEVVVYGLIGLFFMTFLLECIPNILNPYLGLLLGMAANFGVFNSVLAVALGSTIGSSLGFFIGRKYGFRYIAPLFKPATMNKTVRFWNKYGKAYVFLAAITPLPYFPLIFGALKMSWKDFLTFGILARVGSFIVVGLLVYFGFVA